MFEIMESSNQAAVIKVIGVGGCGGNAIDHMIEHGVDGVEFIAANTDAQALNKSRANILLQLGSTVTKGLGAGARPNVGREAALEDRERIAELISGADMLFITAGMGGGTGTGAAPVIAEVAKELDILTVAVVTKPFGFERRADKASEGLDELVKFVDSLIVISNDKLLEVMGSKVAMREAFKQADSVLHGAVAGIAEIIKCPGLINVDFADVKTVMSEMGMAMMGSATATGEDRARIAAEQAIRSPLLENVDLSGARGVLVNITASMDMALGEVHDAMAVIHSFTAKDATVIFGNVFDDNMGDELRVTIVATGLGAPLSRQQPKPFIVHNKTGTDDLPADAVDYTMYDEPAIMRPRPGRRQESGSQVEALRQSGVEMLDIPAFLRKQAD